MEYYSHTLGRAEVAVRFKKTQAGSMLVMGVVTILAIGLLLAGIGRMVESRASVVVDSLVDAQAFYAAESARMKRGDVDFPGGQIYSKKNPGFISGNPCEQMDLYVGWVGESQSWGNAHARHAICYPGGSELDREYAEREDDWDAVDGWDKKDYENVLIPEGEKAQGGGNAVVRGGACLASGASITGKVSFEGDVFIQSKAEGNNPDKEYFSGGAPDFGGCIYIEGEVAEPSHIHQYGGCDEEPGEPTENGHWCGVFENDPASGGNWGYAVF
ncbi:hypothetical protein [Halorhodospira halophila]|uniref:hypothetical protein n=1 Tax=Halorhodospira halophila TaxID=1053 RepID=UPI001198221C|nr:hypothetical protein [Halorhodospira halophila]